MKRCRDITFCGVALAAALATTSFSGPASATDLTLTTWASDPRIHAMWEELAAEFRQENPEFGKLTIQVLPFSEYVAQMTIQLSAGDAPDLGWIVDAHSAAWIQSGALYDLSALKEDSDWAWHDVLPNLVAPYEGENGELWAFPAVNTVHPIYFNQTAFEVAGVESPRDLFDRGEWNLDALRRLAREMVESSTSTVTYGFDARTNPFMGLSAQIVRGFGASPWPDDSTCGLTEPETVASVEFLHRMIFEDGSYKKPGQTPNFESGDTAMVSAPPSYQSLLANVDFEWGMVPQPGGVGEYQPVLSQAALVVWNRGRTPELAARLLAYITSPRGAEIQASVFTPARSQDLEFALDVMVESNPRVSRETIESSVFMPLQFAAADPRMVRFFEIDAAVSPVLDALWVEDADIAAVLNAGCRAAAPFLE